MVSLVGDAFHWTMPVESVQAPGSRDENGPQGLTLKLFGFGLDMVTALKAACHQNLYAIANSNAMNGIGKNTVIEVVKPQIIIIFEIIRNIAIIIFVISCIGLYKKRKG